MELMWTDRIGWLEGNKRNLYKGGVRFESRTEHYLSRKGSSLIFLSSSIRLSGYQPKLCNDRSFPESFYFCITDRPNIRHHMACYTDQPTS
jgi:hypothetical protein